MPHTPSRNLAALALLGGGLALVTPVWAASPAAMAQEMATTLCAGCHGADGNSVEPIYPKLAGQQKIYLLREMKDYKSGKRANDIMVPLMTDVSEEVMAELADYYSKQKTKPGVVTMPKLLPVGKTLYTKGNSKNDVPACESCHEPDGSGWTKFARVAGQHVEYTMGQFRLYASGKRNNGARVMQAVAERMTEQETRAVAEYMASMP